jgi:SAM-dependent methyltransferase
MSNNRDFFSSKEADDWFLRNLSHFDSNATSYNEISFLIDNLKPFKRELNSVLEIGCGTGHRLNFLSKGLDANGYGIDPSPMAIEYIGSKFDYLQVKCSYASDIPFDGPFDLVHLGFFLYLVDRKDYFSCIREADRLLRPGGFLSILDFDPPFPYSNPYSHSEGISSYKIDNSKTFIASGLYTLVAKSSFSHHNQFFNKDVDERISITLLYKESNIFNYLK